MLRSAPRHTLRSSGLAVLFNTLTYAKFFAVVFVVSWLLANRRWAPLLPWVAVSSYALFAAPSPSHFAVAAAALGISLSLCRLSAETPPRSVRPQGGDRKRDRSVRPQGGDRKRDRSVRPQDGDGKRDRRIALASIVVNFAALAWMAFRVHGGPSEAIKAAGGATAFGYLWMTLVVGAALTAAFFLVRAQKVRLLFLLGASYVFYAHWDWRFLPLIFASSSIDWLLGNAIARAEHPRVRKVWLAGTVLLNLGVLGFFKYFNFGIDTARALLASLGVEAPEVALRIALPVGISFFTFESMSYVIDIYRGHIKPQKSYLEYLSFVAFFPHLVAGPIVRPRDLLPQLAAPPRWSAEEGSEALFLIALGLFKKIAIGDYLALNLVDRVFDAPAQYSALECYAAVLGYAVQIYCDFSGYTDIAIGSALLLGVRFPLNFNAPYKATNVQDFWRRWHISLSTWLRDYLYVPLGGNRKGSRRTYVNLMLTMLLGGLWHGASWTFVAWGGLHGAALGVTRAYQRRRPSTGRSRDSFAGAAPRAGRPTDSFAGAALRAGRPTGSFAGAALRAGRPTAAGTLAAAALTFHFVCAAWIFFRAETFQKAASLFAQLATLTTFRPNLHPEVLAVLGVGLLSHWVPERWYTAAREAFIRMPAPAQGLALCAAAITIREMASAEAVPFVYFQF